MWKCLFYSVTNRGTGCNREPVEGEYAVYLPPSLCGWFNVHPHRYMWNGSELVEWPGWEVEEAEQEAAQNVAILALKARVDAIAAAMDQEGLKAYTVPQAQKWINDKLDAATTVAAVKQAVREILLKMVPYILPR